MSGSTGAAPIRALVLGPLGPGHVEDQVMALRERGIESHVGGNASPELESSELAESGVPLSTAPLRSRSTPLGIAATARWVRGLIRELRPDLVHAHWLPGFGFAAAAAGASPLALTAWGSDVYQAGRRMRLASRFAVRRAELVMADSRHLLEACTALGADPGRTELVQWGVDLGAFTPAEGERGELKAALGLGPGPVILSPRSLMPVYNIPEIVTAFGLLAERLPDAQLVLKHMGPVRIELPELPFPERVHVVGNVPYERMPDYYRVADACVSIPATDGSPRSVWEAMACGCPCIVSDLPWVGELLTPGADVVTVRPAAEPLAGALLELLADPERRGAIGGAGRATVMESLDRGAQMDRLAAHYERLARRGGSGER